MRVATFPGVVLGTQSGTSRTYHRGDRRGAENTEESTAASGDLVGHEYQESQAASAAACDRISG